MLLVRNIIRVLIHVQCYCSVSLLVLSESKGQLNN